MVDGDVKRDRWGRPLIAQPDGTTKPYIRTSTLAKALDDQSNLITWECRHTAVGLAKTSSLMDRVVSVVNKHNDPVKDGKAELNQIIRDAQAVSGKDSAADTGTALHELTEILDAGKRLKITPDQWATHLENYQKAMSPHQVIGIETFVANDEVESAGTFDRLLRLADGRIVVADIKTGASDPRFPLKVCIQIATYAHGAVYDTVTGERSEIHPDLDLTTGVLIHMPASDPTGEVMLYELDLVRGWEAAQVARHIYDMRKIKAGDLCKPLFF